MALLGGFAIPGDGFGEILRDAATISVHVPEVDLRGGVALLSLCLSGGGFSPATCDEPYREAESGNCDGSACGLQRGSPPWRRGPVDGFRLANLILDGGWRTVQHAVWCEKTAEASESRDNVGDGRV